MILWRCAPRLSRKQNFAFRSKAFVIKTSSKITPKSTKITPARSVAAFPENPRGFFDKQNLSRKWIFPVYGPTWCGHWHHKARNYTHHTCHSTSICHFGSAFLAFWPLPSMIFVKMCSPPKQETQFCISQHIKQNLPKIIKNRSGSLGCSFSRESPWLLRQAKSVEKWVFPVYGHTWCGHWHHQARTYTHYTCHSTSICHFGRAFLTFWPLPSMIFVTMCSPPEQEIQFCISKQSIRNQNIK